MLKVNVVPGIGGLEWELHYLDRIYLPDEKGVCLGSVGCRCLQLTIFSCNWKIGGELGTYFNIVQ